MTQLYKYQKRGVKKILRFKGRALLGDEMGLGKTIQALTYIKKCPDDTLPALVVCPATAKWVWRAEIRKHTKLSCRILNGRQTKTYQKQRDVTIINYDVLCTWKSVLLKNKFNTIILDECHYIKTWKAKRTKAAVSLGKKIPHVIALSGTPLTNRPKELYTTLHLLLPKLFPSFVPYAFRYCGRRMTPWGWDDSRATHLDELHEILKKHCMIRRTKKQVLKELPEKTRTVIPLPIDRPYEYATAESDFLGWLDKNNVGKVKTAQKAESLVKLGYLKRLAADLKMRRVTEWIDDFLDETDEKLVVFAYHKKVIAQLKDRYKKRCVVVDGSSTQQQRQANVTEFQTGKARLFIGQIVAAGTAITLTAASHVMFAELDWVPGNHIQAEDRLHRIGQKNHVQVYYLIAKNTIEQDLCNVIQKKAKIITTILDGKVKGNDFDVFDQLMKRINERKIV
jgi:SWI/SNF-related matrix-associated actin-dependent regulator of chromatin subfamily A-like protein 1